MLDEGFGGTTAEELVESLNRPSKLTEKESREYVESFYKNPRQEESKLTADEAIKRLRQETCPATYNRDFDKEKCLEAIEREIKWLRAYRDSHGEVLHILKQHLNPRKAIFHDDAHMITIRNGVTSTMPFTEMEYQIMSRWLKAVVVVKPLTKPIRALERMCEHCHECIQQIPSNGNLPHRECPFRHISGDYCEEYEIVRDALERR